MNKYLLQYKPDVDKGITYHLEDVDNELNEQFKLIVESFDLIINGYTVSYCCDLLNEKRNPNIKNRQVESLLSTPMAKTFLLIQKIEGNRKCFFQQIFVK